MTTPNTTLDEMHRAVAGVTPRRFRDDVPLALAEEQLERMYDERPRAFLELLFADNAPATFRLVGAVGVIDVQGALDQRGGWWWDGYDSVVARARDAFNDPRCAAVVLALDSPGGVVAGNLDAARQLRALADAAGKPLVAHANTMATSAAYALACAADRIVVTSDGMVGSVGVISTVYDRTKMTADAGLNVRVVRSGSLKADPHPDVALTDASVARVKARVMDLAQSFAAWVAERRGQTAEAVLAHQGATIYAARALETGLADSIGTEVDAVSLAATLATERQQEQLQMQTLTALIAALGVSAEAEIPAAVATLQQRAKAGDAAEAEVTELRAKLAARDKADAERARADVLGKHRTRGALTPAMESDAEYMGTLATLSPEALDRVLAALPSVSRKAVDPSTKHTTPTGKTAAVNDGLTDDEKRAARASGLSDAEFIAARTALAEEKARRKAGREDDEAAAD